MKQKHALNDYTPSMLPQNRREIFFDVLKLHWKRLIFLGLILLLFYLPILIVGIAKDTYISLLYTNREESAELLYQVMVIEILHSIVNIPLFLIFSLGIAGISRPLRQYGWEENVHTPTDFGKGIRDNGKHTALIALFSGILYALCLILYYYSGTYRSPVMSLISLLPVGISLLVVAPIFAIALIMIPIYQGSLFATLKNAFFVFSRCVWRILGVLILCAAIWIPSLIPNFFCRVFGSVGAVLLTPFAILAFALFCYNQFDLHLNPLVSPELIGKGLPKENI